MEPFDEVLNHQVWALESEMLAWEKTISDRRRTVPTGVRDMLTGLLNHERSTEYEHSLNVDEMEDLTATNLLREHFMFFILLRLSTYIPTTQHHWGIC